MSLSHPETTSSLPEAIIDAAITWSIKLNYNQASQETERQFQAWLQANPLHATAWERINSVRQPFIQADTSSGLVLSTLKQANLKREQHRLKRRKAIQLLSLTTVALGTSWTARSYLPWQRLMADASTSIGEQQTLHLIDSTELILNTDSAVQIDLSGQQRIIKLLRGEIMVTTGADTSQASKRPFLVYTPFGKMEALGTRFVVRLTADNALVSVLEHAVALYPTQSNRYVVKANESRLLQENDTYPADAQGFDAGSWTDGTISGKNIRLADLLTELSRYRRGHIQCDEQVAELRVSGLFHIKDTDKALEFLTHTQPISLTYRTRFWVNVGPAHPHP